MDYKSILHQIEIAVNTIVQMIEKLEDVDLQKRPTPNKQSIGELLTHLAVICEADWRNSNEATESQMTAFYSENAYTTLQSIKDVLLTSFQALKDNYSGLSDEELIEQTTAYWGITYTRYEWLLEIMAHIYHHRGQLHAMLVHCYSKDPKIMMFE
ncbi:DinB family protein [Ureibacillus chungkukjangi]|uniref:Putative damage-inducible protein DinB n=1 Tax=Ureibacillus chungkukjangi TaxID=1202712 RepID=A0A318U170_9BACL|nr:DinB family protein [Ureibacillus chungkukjangi]MCM3387855.1 DinB family protein [Ureibacillus chungkukjangi]PYF05669.1 putative damage-inducible protein DinB [Ureibacillus chungkukjangi]